MLITIAHIFYNQHPMIPIHLTAWRNHKPELARYVFVDDCSPRLLKKPTEIKNVDVYRIVEDISWNIAGARNLAFHVAETDWVLVADVDHVVTSTTIEQMERLEKADSSVVYTFRRQTSEGFVGCHAIINLLMNKRRYFELGGYDEDYSGHYGREETFFWHLLRRRNIRIVHRDDIVLEWYPARGASQGLSRDKSFNSLIFERKMRELQARRYQNGPILRFHWHPVDESD